MNIVYTDIEKNLITTYFDKIKTRINDQTQSNKIILLKTNK